MKQEEKAPPPPPNSKPKPTKTFKTCRLNSNPMLKRRWMSCYQSVVRLVWRFLVLGLGVRRSCTDRLIVGEERGVGYK